MERTPVTARRSAILFTAMLIISLVPSVHADQDSPYPLEHGPVQIEGDIALNSTHGVISGNGSSSDPYLIENWVFNCTVNVGIEVHNTSSHIRISSCIFYGSFLNRSIGIDIVNSSNIEVTDCYSVYSLKAVAVRNSSGIRIGSSVFLGSDIGIDMVNSRDLIIQDMICNNNVLSGISLENCSTVSVTGFLSEHNNAILGGSNGMFISDPMDITISDSSFILCYGSGIMILSDPDDGQDRGIEISDCVFDNDHNGIFMDGVVGVEVMDCIFTYNSYSLYLSSSAGSSINGSNFGDNDYGLYILDSRDITVRENMMDGNERDIVLDGTSGCLVSGNRFRNTTIQSVSIGMFSSLSASYDNSILSNRFLGEELMKGHARDRGEDTIWSDEGKGNLWYDGGEPDIDGDGICDAPYDINGDGTVLDLHPIAHPFLKRDEPESEEEVTEEYHGSHLFLMISALAAVSILSLIVLGWKRDHP